MESMRQNHRRDDGAPTFSPTMFYKLINTNQPKLSLSAGFGQGLNDGTVNITAAGSLSSENWQLFYQDGRYFIRNYDYGAKYQLGLTQQNPQTPRMYISNGNVEQQWSIQSVNGGYQLINGLWGNGTSYNLPKDFVLPAMRSEAGGETWSITDNPSAASSKPLSGDWIKQVDNFQLPSPTPSPSASTSSAIVKTTATSFTAPILLAPSSSATGSNSGTLPQSSNSLPAGAIAGIVIGAVVFLGALCLALWFFMIRKRRNSAHQYAHEVHGEPKVVLEKYACHGSSELATPPVELPGKEPSYAELESPGRRTA